MFVPPFVCGVVTTLLVEMLCLIVYSVLKADRKGDDERD
jgi:hypothetical protein